MLSTVSGATLAWLAADRARRTEATLEWTTDLPPAPVTLTAAASEDSARHRYFQRVELPPADRRPEATRLEISLAEVRFRLPPEVEAAGPFCVHRLGERDWIPPDPAGLRIDAETTLRLPHGSYELADPIDPTRRQSFSVPGPGPIELSPDLRPHRSAPR